MATIAHDRRKLVTKQEECEESWRKAENELAPHRRPSHEKRLSAHAHTGMALNHRSPAASQHQGTPGRVPWDSSACLMKVTIDMALGSRPAVSSQTHNVHDVTFSRGDGCHFAASFRWDCSDGNASKSQTKTFFAGGRISEKRVARKQPPKRQRKIDVSTLQILAMAFFSQPKSDRPVYQLMRRLRPRRIIELGIGDGNRSERMIRLAGSFGPVHFVGIDMFEGSPAGVACTTLKNAHQRLSRLRGEIRLLPGDAGSALPRHANELTNTDLVIISATQQPAGVAKAQKYLPRMLHANSRVMLESPGPSGQMRWQVLTFDEVLSAAAGSSPRRRRAA